MPSSSNQYHDLLRIVGLLHRTLPRFPPFNMLRVLRSESDEVRLHSRMIAALIDPARHLHGLSLLQTFLNIMEIPATGPDAFALSGVRVQVEYLHIDILITNDQRQALLIENKVYAGDRDLQLRSYYDQLRAKGYGNIFVRYLSLDGRPPEPQSLAGLDAELSAPYLCYVSYSEHIRAWLSQCESAAVRDVPLRESIAQYAAVIDQLTGLDQNKDYMDAIVETLLIGETMLVAKDILTGYERALVELQERLWRDIQSILTQEYPALMACSIKVRAEESPERRTIESYYRPASRNNRYFGLYFRVPGWDNASVGIEIEKHLYSGVHCDKASFSTEHLRVKQVLAEQDIHGKCTDSWPIWQWCGEKYNLERPDDDTLRMLTDTTKRAAFARTCADDLAMFWQALQV